MLAYLSLGSNLGNREAQLREAEQRLSTLGSAISVSSYYETEPVEFTNQPWFLNAALALETNLTPQDLMHSILQIEREMGRKRRQEKGPRTIDIDILLFGNQILNSSDVTIPHPAMHQRRFVLEPLAEIAPEARNPLLNKTVRELLAELPEGPVVRKCQTA
jgi:2-amino-4-hydroxy-6-hydroxymethyldihydropteridine diphosphokinase